MTIRKREARVFAALAVSMTVAMLILKALSQNPPAAGAFCLTRYNDLPAIEKAVALDAGQPPRQWNTIEIFYSQTRGGNIEELAELEGLTSPDELNCHFIIGNGLGADDGQIIKSVKWQKQLYAGSGIINDKKQTVIRICVIADKIARPTDFQIKRTEALTEILRRKFDIESLSVYYPDDWL
jgi:hypothetical protein